MLSPRLKHISITCAVWLARLLTGCVFIVSGSVKMIDPYGFIYKIGDYLTAWSLNLPEGLILFAAVALSLTEFLVGIALATGTLRRVAVWAAMAMMAFMLPLTLYIAIFSPVEDCGCFGDFIILSNWATFWKNILITAALIFLLIKNRTVRCLFPPMSQWLQLAIAGAWIAWVGAVGYFIQPLVDFRPYPVGSPLLHEPDLSEVFYIYESADGSVREFPATALPDEENGEWSFIGISENNPSLHESTLAITDADGNDVTFDVVGVSPAQLLLLIPDIDDAGISDTYTANELAQYITQQQVLPDAFAAIVHASSEADLNQWLDLSMADYPVYSAEDTTIKTIARGKMAVVYLQNDTIIWKRTLASINPELISESGFDIASLAPAAGYEFKRSLLLMISAEMILLLLAQIFGHIKKSDSGK